MTPASDYIRRLNIALMISGALNIALISFVCYWVFSERPPTPYEHRPANIQEQQSPLAIDHSNSEVIRYFRKMPLEWLIARLDNTKLVESGYTQRDLALACLVAFHNFDLSRALPNLPSADQLRVLVYGKFRDGAPAELTIYPGLSDKQYKAIYNFATTERWPLTVKGLFFILRKQPAEGRDLSLVDAFMMSPEFMTVEMLFSRGEQPADKNDLLNVVLQGNWEVLTSFVEQQKVTQDLSQARRQRFLLDYIEQQSKAAAYFMLKNDAAFAANKLDDKHVVLLLQLLDEKSPEAEQFALAQLASPRTDQVWKLAATRLYEYAGESIPDQYQHNAALSRFIPKHPLLQKNESISIPVTSSAPPILPPPTKQKNVSKPTVAKDTPPIKAKPVSEKPKVVLPVDQKAKADKNIGKVESQKVVKKDATKKEVSKTEVTKKEAKLAAGPVKTKDHLHIVGEGETLQQIAVLYKVDLVMLRAYNRLENDQLRAGRVIKIPVRI